VERELIGLQIHLYHLIPYMRNVAAEENGVIVSGKRVGETQVIGP